MKTYNQNQVKSAVLAFVDDKKAQSILDALKKSSKKSTKKGSDAKSSRISLDSETLRIISEKPTTKTDIIKQLVKIFPVYKDSDKAEVLLLTTRRRLSGYLDGKYNVKVEKNDKGEYFVKAKKPIDKKVDEKTTDKKPTNEVKQQTNMPIAAIVIDNNKK